MNKFFKWGLSVLALSVLAACGGNSSSHATGLASSQSHATGLTSESSHNTGLASSDSHATGLTSDESSHATGLTSEELTEDLTEELTEDLTEELTEDLTEESSEDALPVFYVCGTFNEWTQKDANYQMTYDEVEELYVFEGLNLKAGAQFKVMGDSGWYPTENVTVSENGKYDISFEAMTGFVECERVGDYEGEIGETIYYLVGTFNKWEKDANYALAFDEANDWYFIDNVALTAGGLKVVDSDGVWYPDGVGNDYQITVDGTYDVTFDPAGGHEGWYESYFKVTPVAD